LKIAKEDLKALEDFISNKKYLFGDHPCVEDAVVFAWTCQFLYVDTGPLNKHFTSKQLVEYINVDEIVLFCKLNNF
jgi:glutathione S-transferase